MKKFTLFFVLLILFLSFLSFYFNVWNMLQQYWKSNFNQGDQPENIQVNDLSSKPSVYLDYSKETYDSILNAKGILVLYFTANWCSECITQDDLNKEVLTSDKLLGVAGLRIHILDSETSEETSALAKKFDVTKENSFVILDKDGAVFFKYVGLLSKELLEQKIMEVINK